MKFYIFLKGSFWITLVACVPLNKIFFTISILFFTNIANAEEQRCKNLGVNCICSEPLNTSTWVNANGNAFFNPADTTTKECSASGVAPGAVLEDGSGFLYQSVSSGPAVSALPAGHTITYVLRTNDGRGGQALSHKFAASAPTALRSFRFYRYYSSDHVWTDSAYPGCNSGKLLQLGFNGAFTGGPLVSMGISNQIGFYDVNTSFGWSQNMAPNCCASGPGSNLVTLPTQSQLRGKWWRIEFALHNAAPGGPPTYWEMWIKNVTDNLPEMKVLDSRVSTTANGPDSSFWWQSPMTDGLHVTTTISEMSINMFRSPNSSPCPGYIANTHALWAAWPTDAGQRIGPASEIEGNGGIISQPPKAPKNLRVQ